MRFIRLLFILGLAVILLTVALANRGMATLRLLPASLDQYFGTQLTVTLPMFMILLLAVLFGIVVGFIWEYLREAHIRSIAARRTFEVQRLEREVGALRQQHHAPRDEVLAIIDRPKTAPAAAPVGTVPATNSPRTPALPVRR
ncbi:DUF1049 domain-containing protein [Paracoccus jeotgali]|uniref:DUF1049 domain-containing protein n=1 Tax=Paracoccus jeotgali TaxID=2065379 RepID=UPI0018645448|nr:DUF1049 domain-containing protein [Paracoccus jeotgali]